MLAAILKMAAEGGAVTTGEVARAFSIDAALAETLFRELERQGYLKAVATGCGQACGGLGKSCGGCAAPCGSHSGLRLWTFTGKGASAAARAGKSDQLPPL